MAILGEDDQTLTFGFLGADYEIDLSQQQANQFSNVLQKSTDAGRRVGGRRESAGSHSSTPTGRKQLATCASGRIRTATRCQAAGRIPQEIQDAPHAAN